MENGSFTTDAAPRRNSALVWWGVGAAVVILVCCACLVVIGVLAITIMGPTTGRVFSQISPSLDTTVVPAPLATATSQSSTSHPQASGNALGDPNAPVKIVEYGDYQCPYCANFWRETEKSLITDYVNTGKVYFVYRSVGAFIGPESGRAAQASYCASDQGKFWDYHDVLYAHQGPENSGAFADDKLTAFARSLGLDVEQFGSCLRSNKYQSRVDQDAAAAAQDGANATPSFVINGKQLIQGAQPYDVFVTAIQAVLGGQ